MQHIEIKIGKEGIKKIQGAMERLIPWESIVGINYHHTRSEIYLNTGEKIKFKNIFSANYIYKVFDYGDNYIDQSKPESLFTWKEIFIRIRTYINERGKYYIAEFEGIYNSWMYLIPGMANKHKILFPKEEKKERIVCFIFLFIFFITWLSLVIHIFLNGDKNVNDNIGLIITFAIMAFWIFGIVFLFHYGSGRKIKKILKRNNIFNMQ